ncbi:MAG TPA: 4a-hydroxytetrahydrobiopterin dehydratase [Trebonia sp.]|jgi:4a-hydroxytetrahydrobiopterin dehydratase|nr:4a-hydroxytetrahydrobiopterin dehydratase [Trebonia sp.]
MELLTPDQVDAGLATTPGWELADGGHLARTLTWKDFGEALRYVNAVGFLAEQAGHHPDIFISWSTVRLTLSTHSIGGLTDSDFALARAISALG